MEGEHDGGGRPHEEDHGQAGADKVHEPVTGRPHHQEIGRKAHGCGEGAVRGEDHGDGEGLDGSADIRCQRHCDRGEEDGNRLGAHKVGEHCNEQEEGGKDDRRRRINKENGEQAREYLRTTGFLQRLAQGQGGSDHEYQVRTDGTALPDAGSSHRWPAWRPPRRGH